MPRGSLKDFTVRITGGGKSGKNLGAVAKLNRKQALDRQGDIPKSEFGQISAGLPKRGRARKGSPTTLSAMGTRLRGKKP